MKEDDTIIDNEELFFEQLKATCAAHRRRVDAIAAAEPPAKPDYRHSTPYRRRMRAAYAVCLAISLFAAVYWGLSISELAFNTPSLVVCLCIEAVYLMLVAESLFWTIGLARHTPARSGITEMSRFYRLAHMRPHYAPRAASEDTPQSLHVDFRRCTTASAAAAVALILVSCTPRGDGHTITQDHPGRAATIATVDKIFTPQK